MATYIYETIPSSSSEKPNRFEFRQGMKDAPLVVHPETGQPVRRVISGGISVLPKKGSPSSDSSCCSSGTCCS
ncbi:MAG: hypothetical protein CMO75_04100 [Verrucomicrobiales bacterium]|nr:hypothetical protein [Verrucomicrobiales bacterium]